LDRRFFVDDDDEDDEEEDDDDDQDKSKFTYLNTRFYIHKTNYADCVKITCLCDFNLPPQCK